MAVNKVIYDQTTLIDLTSDTIAAEWLKAGKSAHDKAGNLIVGTAQCFPLDPIVYDHNIGYISAGSWIYENQTQTYIDIYEVEAGNTYLISLGSVVGSRFRCMYTATDITQVTSGTIIGTQIINQNNPQPNASATYKCTADGYVLAAKDNVGKSGLKSYVLNLTKTCA